MTSLPPCYEIEAPRTSPPPDTCDAHFHVIGPVARFPFAASRAFTPDDVPIEAAIKLHDALGIARGVVVQCNPHGTDNSALLDALMRYPQRLRGVAIVEPTVSRSELQRMVDTGVRALRFHHMPGTAGYSPVGLRAVEILAPLMAELGLHAQFMVEAAAIDDVLASLKGWLIPVVVDHMGNIDAAHGVQQAPVTRMCQLLDEGRIWVKVSGSYRLSKQFPDYEDAGRVCQALVRSNPERILWGSDWPHTRLTRDMPRDHHLLDLFHSWVTSSAHRQSILVNNPQMLYGYH